MNKIPKIIHYCWFGRGPKSELALNCIESWKKNLPDYEIKEWNEDNFDLEYNQYVKEAYENKKYAFVSDVARLYIIYKYGGIYLDVDVEVIKSFDSLLENEAFFGFEDKNNVNTGLGFGAKKNNKIVKSMLEEYKNIGFKTKEGFDLTPCPVRNTLALVKKGLLKNNMNQEIDNAKIFSTEYFCPKNYETGEIKLSKNTFTIHHFNASWHTKKEKKQLEKKKKLLKKYGEKKGLEKYITYLKMQKTLNYLTYPIKVILNPKKAIQRIRGIK